MGDQERRRDVSIQIESDLVWLYRRLRGMFTLLVAQVHPGVEAAAYGLLGVLHDAGPVRSSELVDRLGVDKSTVSRQVAEVVRLGLAERVIDPADGRARLIRLTEQGTAELLTVRAERHRRLQELFANWSTEELDELARWLDRLTDAL